MKQTSARREKGRREARREQRRGALPALTLNLTAMIDVVFMLLIFFILTVDFRPREDALAMDSPERETASAVSVAPSAGSFTLPPRPVVVGVRSNGDGPNDYVLWTDEPALGPVMHAPDLERGARAARGHSLPDSQAFTLRAEPDARWEHALAALNALQRAGFTNIALAKPAPGAP